MPRKSKSFRAPARAVTDALKTRRSERATRAKSVSAANGPVPRNDLQPELLVSERRIDTLKVPARKVRNIDAAHVAKIARSIKQFGFCNPVLIKVDGTVVDGLIRIEAAKQCGLATIPCIAIEHLSEDEIRALTLTLNRLQEKGSWNLDALKLEFEELLELDFELEITGFEIPEIDSILGLDDEGPGEPIDQTLNTVPVLDRSQPALTRLGDLWLLGNHRILCGDALDSVSYSALLNDRPVACVFADPPYNVPVNGHVGGKGRVRHPEFAMASGEMSTEEFTAFIQNFLRHACPTLEQGALIYLFMDWRHTRELLAAAQSLSLEQVNLCVWVKSNGGMGSFYRSQHELVFVFRRSGTQHRNNVQLGRYGRNRTNVWSYEGVNTLNRERRADLALHPTVKPVELVADAILDCTAPGELVLDPFLGSGTTLLAAEKTGRHCAGIELDPYYVDVAIRRWQALTGETAVLAETGQTFNNRAARAGGAGLGPNHQSAPGAGLSAGAPLLLEAPADPADDDTSNPPEVDPGVRT